MQFGARVVLASLFLVLSDSAGWSDDDDPPKPTQEQVLGNLLMAKAPGETEKAEPPQPIQPLSKAERKALKDEHRIVSGSRWGSLTPEQRDELMRNLRKANAVGAIFLIDVRTGDVYKFDPLPPTEERNKTPAERLSELYHVPIRYFDLAVDLVKLPVSVGQGSASQSDRNQDDFVVRGPPEPL